MLLPHEDEAGDESLHLVTLPEPGLRRLNLHRGKTLIRYQASDSATVLAMIRAGPGITLLPRMMLPKKLEGVVALPLEPAQPLPIGLGVKALATAVPGARLFIQTALDWIQKEAA